MPRTSSVRTPGSVSRATCAPPPSLALPSPDPRPEYCNRFLAAFDRAAASGRSARPSAGNVSRTRRLTPHSARLPLRSRGQDPLRADPGERASPSPSRTCHTNHHLTGPALRQRSRPAFPRPRLTPPSLCSPPQNIMWITIIIGVFGFAGFCFVFPYATHEKPAHHCGWTEYNGDHYTYLRKHFYFSHKEKEVETCYHPENDGGVCMPVVCTTSTEAGALSFQWLILMVSGRPSRPGLDHGPHPLQHSHNDRTPLRSSRPCRPSRTSSPSCSTPAGPTSSVSQPRTLERTTANDTI